jgi:hypothetical protein
VSVVHDEDGQAVQKEYWKGSYEEEQVDQTPEAIA